MFAALNIKDFSEGQSKYVFAADPIKLDFHSINKNARNIIPKITADNKKKIYQKCLFL